MPANINPRGQQRDKPFRDALRMEFKALESGETIEHPPGSLRWNAQQLLLKGDVNSIREIADRLDGKVPQALTGADDTPLIPEFSEEQRIKAVAVLFAKAGVVGLLGPSR